MKLSLSNSINDLSDEQITSLVYGKLDLLCGNADVALLLGGSTDVMDERVASALKLFNGGKVNYICPTGGVEWDTGKGKMSECDYMSAVLIENGVPKENIIRENEARTTIENMIYGSLQIQRSLGFNKVKKIAVVSSNSHLRRSFYLGGIFLPKTVEVSVYTSKTPFVENDWTQSEHFRKKVMTEARLLLELYKVNMIPDVEF